MTAIWLVENLSIYPKYCAKNVKVSAESWNRPFPSSKKSHFQNEAKCETFVVKMSFICIIIENHFHINGFALSLVLKVRFFGTRKWPINRSFPSSPGLCFKTRVGAQPLIWKSFFILMQIKLIFTRKVVHLATFWKWGFLELRSGVLTKGGWLTGTQIGCLQTKWRISFKTVTAT